MDLKMRPMEPEERAFTYTQDMEMLEQAGCLGHLRGDMGPDGNEFWTTWDDHVSALKTDSFKKELDQVIQTLRSDKQFGGVLQSREAMKAYCRQQPDSAFEGSSAQEYAFRADTDDYSYMLRCNPNKGDYNFYVYVYNREMLDAVLEPEKDKIRVLVVEPEKRPYVKEIGADLASLQHEVGGYIQAVYPFAEPVGIICDEEGKLKGSTLNRALRDSEGHIYDILAGTFLVVGLGEEDFDSLTDEHIQQFSEHFKTPELFVKIDGKLMVIPIRDAVRDEPERPSFFERVQNAESKAGKGIPANEGPDMKRTER